MLLSPGHPTVSMDRRRHRQPKDPVSKSRDLSPQGVHHLKVRRPPPLPMLASGGKATARWERTSAVTKNPRAASLRDLNETCSSCAASIKVLCQEDFAKPAVKALQEVWYQSNVAELSKKMLGACQGRLDLISRDKRSCVLTQHSLELRPFCGRIRYCGVSPTDRPYLRVKMSSGRRGQTFGLMFNTVD